MHHDRKKVEYVAVVVQDWHYPDNHRGVPVGMSDAKQTVGVGLLMLLLFLYRSSAFRA